MKQATIIFVAIAITKALAPAAVGDIGGGRKSRLPAATDANGKKKCSIDPLACYSAGSPGQRRCGDTGSGRFNCGECGRLCKFTQAYCGSKCVNLAVDEKHCGSCFNRCNKTCLYGLCDYA
ncbi:Stigma-specific protein, Stig1 [Musa troglodytarum]|uniref:Stigma-specific protein, Stig1 n=1 Tax=Musa troglodytarum TaxID=320322 RepID=A0A9E7GAU1_9LILI|nr:Stigma-specific protein, Stig1 [Musa troglodytarum]